MKAFTAIGADEYVEFSAVRNTRLVSARVTFGEWSEPDRYLRLLDVHTELLQSFDSFASSGLEKFQNRNGRTDAFHSLVGSPH